MSNKVVAIVGPTASGKTKLSVALAKQLNGEIVSTDSMQIYRGMDIGTAKPTLQERENIPHHMIDVINPNQDFSVAKYVSMATPIVDDILSRGKCPILVGGTGLYLDSILSGRNFAPVQEDKELRERLEQEYDSLGGEAMWVRLDAVDPKTAQRFHSNDRKRLVRALEVYYLTGKTISQHDEETRKIPPRYEALRLGLAFEHKLDMWNRIDVRVDEMMAQGLFKEIDGLLQSGIPITSTAMQAIGYKEFVAQDIDVQEAVAQVKIHSRQYAKRQLTWFRRNTETKWHIWRNTINFNECLQSSTAYLEDFGIL